MKNTNFTKVITDENTIQKINISEPVSQHRTDSNSVRSGRYGSFLMMPEFFRTPGSADEVLRSLTDDTDRDIFAAQLAYHRGDIELSRELCEKLLANAKNDDIVTLIGSYLLITSCALYLGDLQLWSNARFGLASLKGKDETEREYISFSIAVTDTVLFNTDNLPDWFKRGSFGQLHPEIFPAVRVAFAMYLQSLAYQVLHEPGYVSSQYDIAHTYVMTCEQMASQTAADCVITAEIPLRLICAAGYHNIGQDKVAKMHIDRVIELALPDRLYSALSEYYTGLDFLLDNRLGTADKSAQRQVREMSKRFKKGWMSLHNAVYKQSLYEGFTVREREVAKFAAFGLTNQEIANQLHISIETVKKALQAAMLKTGASKRTELSKYV